MWPATLVELRCDWIMAAPLLATRLKRLTVWLALLDGRDVVAVDGVESRQVVRTSVRRGYVMPTATSASGKAILAALGPERWHRLLPQEPPPALRAELETARRAGYAISVGEVDPAVHTVAAAVASADGEPIGALIVAAPGGRGALCAVEVLP